MSGKLSPHSLPRSTPAPIAVSVAGQISTIDESPPPQLKLLTIEINRHGRLDYTGLPLCRSAKIQLASNAARPLRLPLGPGRQGHLLLEHRHARRAALSLDRGSLLVFNGREGDHQVLYGHIYDFQPFPTSFVLTFEISRPAATAPTAPH